MLAELRDYNLHPKYKFVQAFYRLILLIQKNQKINILSVPLINLNFPPSLGAKKGSDELHFDHFTIIFWVKCTFIFSPKMTLLSLFGKFCRKFAEIPLWLLAGCWWVSSYYTLIREEMLVPDLYVSTLKFEISQQQIKVD